MGDNEHMHMHMHKHSQCYGTDVYPPYPLTHGPVRQRHEWNAQLTVSRFA